MVIAGRDRSLELYQLFDKAKARQAAAPPGSAEAQRYTPKAHGAASTVDQVNTTRFYSSAGKFSKELSGTSGMIADLADLMKQQTVFDDQAPEIAKLTAIVKDRLAKLHDELGTLVEAKNAAVAAQGRGAQQAERHSETVVNTLRSKLGQVGQGFKGVLTTRTKALKENCLRTGEYTSNKTTSFESALFQRAQETEAAPMQLDSSHQPSREAAAAGGEYDYNGAQQQQMQLQTAAPSNVNYFGQRHDAIRELEGTVVEIGEIFHDFNRLVHEQEELVLRIDSDVNQAVDHMDGGISQLLQYLGNLSSNRGLILKIFGVLFFFLLFFGLVVVR